MTHSLVVMRLLTLAASTSAVRTTCGKAGRQAGVSRAQAGRQAGVSRAQAGAGVSARCELHDPRPMTMAHGQPNPKSMQSQQSLCGAAAQLQPAWCSSTATALPCAHCCRPQHYSLAESRAPCCRQRLNASVNHRRVPEQHPSSNAAQLPPVTSATLMHAHAHTAAAAAQPMSCPP